mmetsp:Transcript_831/g.1745  ORF Transcript_831/g.1745 Transcript_831/m.1745 type:complete len:231 (-) Transcript_831:251-943(-)
MSRKILLCPLLHHVSTSCSRRCALSTPIPQQSGKVNSHGFAALSRRMRDTTFATSNVRVQFSMSGMSAHIFQLMGDCGRSIEWALKLCGLELACLKWRCHRWRGWGYLLPRRELGVSTVQPKKKPNHPVKRLTKVDAVVLARERGLRRKRYAALITGNLCSGIRIAGREWVCMRWLYRAPLSWSMRRIMRLPQPLLLLLIMITRMVIMMCPLRTAKQRCLLTPCTRKPSI